MRVYVKGKKCGGGGFACLFLFSLLYLFSKYLWKTYKRRAWEREGEMVP